MKKLTFGSLFAGIGGVCRGFANADFKPCWANEWDKRACETYRNNFKHKIVEGDIHDISDPLKQLGYVDVVTSGFPCQAFSVAGYRLGFKDPRGNLFFETARFIDSIKPKAFLLENVKNLVGHDGGRTFKIIEEVVTKELGYSFIPFVLNAKDFGVPQTRERIYVVGFKDEANIPFFEEDSLFNFNNENSKKCTSKFKIPNKKILKKRIEDLLSQGEQDNRFYYREDSKYFKKLESEIKKTDTVYQWRRVYVRENKSKLCPTLTANMGTGGHNVPLIRDPFGIRKLTPEECLRFQGFDNAFEFPTEMAMSHCYKQSGNSVVVPVITEIAKNIKNAIKER